MASGQRNTAQAKPDWFQTKSAQFITDSLTDADTSGDTVILLVTPSSSVKLSWDNGGTECNYFTDPLYFACLFQPGQPCTLKTAEFYISRSFGNASARCSLFVWGYLGSAPNTVDYGPVVFRPKTSRWVSVNLPTPYYDSDGQFWVGAFFREIKTPKNT